MKKKEIKQKIELYLLNNSIKDKDAFIKFNEKKDKNNLSIRIKKLLIKLLNKDLSSIKFPVNISFFDNKNNLQKINKIKKPNIVKINQFFNKKIDKTPFLDFISIKIVSKLNLFTNKLKTN
jgi:hypothetical protein